MFSTSDKSRADFVNQYYYAKELALHPSCLLTGDSTPSYLLDSRRVIPRRKRLFSHHNSIKLMVMMRDSVARAQSHYALVNSLDRTPAQIKACGTEWRNLTLMQVIRQDLSKMQSCGLVPYWNIDTAEMDLDKLSLTTFVGHQRKMRLGTCTLVDTFYSIPVPTRLLPEACTSYTSYEHGFKPFRPKIS